jgi:hypothetical protein
MALRPLVLAAGATLGLAGTPARADFIRYTDSPSSFPFVTNNLLGEFGTAGFPPLVETTQSFYQVEGTGPVDLTFRFRADTGTFLFQFGFYRTSAALEAIDLSTDAGRIAYATQALAPGNATLVFDDRVDNPGVVRRVTANGGDILGFFLIPDDTLARFQTNPVLFAVEGVGSVTLGAPAPFRFPLFGLADANPQGRDQLLSFSGTSAVTGMPTTLFAWEDLTRAVIPGNPFPSDVAFNDLIFAIEGIRAVDLPGPGPDPNAVPEPASLVLLGVGAVGLAGVRRLRRRTA